MRIPDYLTCLLRNLYAGQEATVRTGHGTTNRFKTGKGECQGYIYCHPAYLTYMQSASWEMPGWMNHKLESRLQEKYQQPHICRYHSNGRKQRRTKKHLGKSERGQWKSWLKTQHSERQGHGICSHHFMAKKLKQWQTLFSWVPKSLQAVTTAMKLKDACSLEENLWQT